MNNPTLRNALVSVASFIFVITVVQAWTVPTGGPPDPNVAAPITIDGVNQVKSGALGVAALSSEGGVQIGNTSIACDEAHQGTVRWTGTIMEYCGDSLWKTLDGGLGYNQVWQNMLGSSVGCEAVRASGVLCTNDTTKPIQVNITTHSSNVTVYCYSGVGTGLMVGGAQRYQNGWGDSMGSLSFIVPPGETYHCDTPNAWVQAWVELRDDLNLPNIPVHVFNPNNLNFLVNGPYYEISYSNVPYSFTVPETGTYDLYVVSVTNETPGAYSGWTAQTSATINYNSTNFTAVAVKGTARAHIDANGWDAVYVGRFTGSRTFTILASGSHTYSMGTYAGYQGVAYDVIN
ncbi:MAG: hypothetical protein K9M10_02905 [Candidatus Pacebacteria bacterium]|nr:hypothetical protein [Candidatus Paceibacterota bacterium]MCF7857402.1 hypothetical protein [Candidatus Paceibacterota bacterium]